MQHPYHYKSLSLATKQYALTLKTDAIIRRKIALMAKIENTLVAEVELDEIPGVYTITFVPNDPRIVNLVGDENKVPQLWLMWKHRSFNLLLNQQNDLHLTGLELSLLDTDEEQPIIRYHTNQVGSASSSVLKSGFNGDLALSRNQWYKFDGRLAKPSESV